MVKKLYRRKKNYRRKSRKTSVPKNRLRMPPGLISVKKTYQGPVIQQTSTTNLTQSGGFQFQLNNVSELSSMALLFDQYRICAVKIKFLPGFSSASGVSNAATQGQVWTYWDNTDSASPQSTVEVMNRQKYRLHNSTRSWTEYCRSITPADAVYRNAGVLSGWQVSTDRKWYSTTTTDIPYYGFKWLCENMQNYNFLNTYITLYVQFKDAK